MAKPTVSIIVPTLNQTRYLRAALTSVLNQDYPPAEVLVFDGGSSDGTVEVLESFGNAIHWRSQRDEGQPFAVNRGLAAASGDIVKWFSSDDVMCPGALRAVADAFMREPDAIYVGGVRHIRGTRVRCELRPSAVTRENVIAYWRRGAVWQDPGVFYSRAVIRSVGPVDETLHYAFDYDYLIRALAVARPVLLNMILAEFRLHARSKTVAAHHRMISEGARVSARYSPPLEESEMLRKRQYDEEETVRTALAAVRGGRLGLFMRLMADRPILTMRSGIAFLTGRLQRPRGRQEGAK